jgi:hypothetical protein
VTVEEFTAWWLIALALTVYALLVGAVWALAAPAAVLVLTTWEFLRPS